jgi:hypothetical protein
MNAPITVLDPTDERLPVERPRAARLSSVVGKRITLLDISKARGDIFLDRLAEHLEERGAKVERLTKATFARIAPAALCQEVASQSDAVIEALAD